MYEWRLEPGVTTENSGVVGNLTPDDGAKFLKACPSVSSGAAAAVRGGY